MNLVYRMLLLITQYYRKQDVQQKIKRWKIQARRQGKKKAGTPKVKMPKCPIGL